MFPERLHGAGCWRRVLGGACGLLVAHAAHASEMETLAKVADVLAVLVLFLVPLVAISVFWLVHVLPEKIAHKRHHPQREAIQVLCLLSLVFGGLLWPFALLWAYSKPVFYRLAYGTDVEAGAHVVEGQEGRSGADVAAAPATVEEAR